MCLSSFIWFITLGGKRSYIGLTLSSHLCPHYHPLHMTLQGSHSQRAWHLQAARLVTTFKHHFSLTRKLFDLTEPQSPPL